MCVRGKRRAGPLSDQVLPRPLRAHLDTHRWLGLQRDEVHVRVSDAPADQAHVGLRSTAAVARAYKEPSATSSDETT